MKQHTELNKFINQLQFETENRNCEMLIKCNVPKPLPSTFLIRFLTNSIYNFNWFFFHSNSFPPKLTMLTVVGFLLELLSLNAVKFNYIAFFGFFHWAAFASSSHSVVNNVKVKTRTSKRREKKPNREWIVERGKKSLCRR